MAPTKKLIRDLYAHVLHTTGASRLDRMPANRLLILTFHRVLPQSKRDQYPLPGLAVTPAELKWVLREVCADFEIETVSAAVQRSQSSQRSKPALSISFDDGQLDNLRYALPVLRELGIKATFYVPTDYIGSSRLLWHDEVAFAWARAEESLRRELWSGLVRSTSTPAEQMSGEQLLEELKCLNLMQRMELVETLREQVAVVVPDWARLMKWPEVQQLVGLGHEIGSHGCTHELLPDLNAADQCDEIERSMTEIQVHTGETPLSFCYPNGSYDASTVASVRNAGYENAVTTRWGINSPGQNNFEILRCDVHPSHLLDRNARLSSARLAMRLSGLQPGLAA